MTTVKLEMDINSYEVIKKACENLNRQEFETFATYDKEEEKVKTVTQRNETKFPFYTICDVKDIAVPPYEGSEREYNYNGKVVLGCEVGDFLEENDITFEEFKKDAQHMCDRSTVEFTKGFFLTAEDCDKYIDDNIDKLNSPYCLQSSFDDNEGLKELFKALFDVVGIKPGTHLED